MVLETGIFIGKFEISQNKIVGKGNKTLLFMESTSTKSISNGPVEYVITTGPLQETITYAFAEVCIAEIELVQLLKNKLYLDRHEQMPLPKSIPPLPLPRKFCAARYSSPEYSNQDNWGRQGNNTYLFSQKSH
jgi:hypothetical protein